MTHSRVTFYCARIRWGFRGDTFLVSRARAKATNSVYATTTVFIFWWLMIVAPLLNLSLASVSESRRFPYNLRKCQHLATLVWGQPLRNLAKTARYVELDYLCHVSSEAVIASNTTTKARQMPKLPKQVQNGEWNWEPVKCMYLLLQVVHLRSADFHAGEQDSGKLR